MASKKNPYMSKICEIYGFDVWKVNGSYIRKNIDEEFTNFGQHFRFKFIPKNEFWIDKEFCPDETHYYVTHLLVENILMASGKSYYYALQKADEKENLERKKSAFYKKTMNYKKKVPKRIIDKIHKKELKEYNDKTKIWIVNGEIIRDLFFIDFTEGGHDIVYHFVPKNEIWLDDDLSPKERDFVLLHEICERNLMAKGKDYNSAHMIASSIEHHCRLNPKKTKDFLKEEFKKNN